jgi:exodeoxyribonuclease V alpha subunit
MNTSARQWFAGKAVMITRNHRALQLFNGDVGVTIATERGLRVIFPAADGRMHAMPPARLPAHEPAYALTVHKAQGSEFDQVLVMLPPRESPLLSRELLYTAVTRARSRVTIWGSQAALRAAIARPTERGTGLREACWDEDDELPQP